MIGVFGGTFDPPHRGHLVLAEAGRVQLGLEQVLWVVTAVPPHKPAMPLTPADDRLQMVSLLLDGMDGHRISRVDIDRPGPHFAVDTLALLEAQQPGTGWVYLLGEDLLRRLPQWKGIGRFVAHCAAIGVLGRSSHVDWAALEEAAPGIQAKMRMITAPEIEVSSSGIRRTLRAGEPIRDAVTPLVAAYIQAKGLYQA